LDCTARTKLKLRECELNDDGRVRISPEPNVATGRPVGVSDKKSGKWACRTARLLGLSRKQPRQPAAQLAA
jgi:hypothetical protein